MGRQNTRAWDDDGITKLSRYFSGNNWKLPSDGGKTLPKCMDELFGSEGYGIDTPLPDIDLKRYFHDIRTGIHSFRYRDPSAPPPGSYGTFRSPPKLHLRDDLHNEPDFALRPLHVAAAWDSARGTTMLLNRGADVNALSGLSRNALFFAVFSGNAKLAEKLLYSGSKVDLLDSHGFAPIHYSYFIHSAVMLEILLKYGTNPDTKDSRGKTFFRLVVENPDKIGNGKMIELLLKYGGTPPMDLYGKKKAFSLLMDRRGIKADFDRAEKAREEFESFDSVQDDDFDTGVEDLYSFTTLGDR